MDTNTDGYLTNLEINLASSSETRGDGIGGSTAAFGLGHRTGQDANTSNPIPHLNSSFTFSNSHHHPHPDNMDLANFNNVFSEKSLDGGGMTGGGRRDDNAGSGGPPGPGSPSSSHQPGNPNANSSNNINFEALQQLLNMQMQMQLQTPPNPMPNSMSMPYSSSMSLPGSVDVSSTPGQSHGHPGSQNNQQAAALLEQQLRLQQLQQLQQLQNQIFQQQIELISGQTSLSSSLEATPIQAPAFRDTSSFQGLPTPANSTELRPQPPPNFVSPMILQNYLNQPSGAPTNQFSNAHSSPQGPSSAPAHLAFSTHAPLLSPSDLDFELSPITSPWLGAASYQQAQQHLQQQQQQPQQSQTQGSAHSHGRFQSQTQVQTQVEPKRRASKRGVSSSEDDADGLGSRYRQGSHNAQARKRQSPAIRASLGGSGSNARRTSSATSSRRSGSASMTSTPAMRAQQSHQQQRPSVFGEVVGDTPSPVDLSMPPPAPPISEGDSTSTSTSATAVGASIDGQQPDTASGTVSTNVSSSPNSALSPVTPASIMNLGRLGLGSGLASPLSTASEERQGTGKQAKGKGKSKGPPKGSSTSTSIPASTSTSVNPGAPGSAGQPAKSVSKKSSSTSLVSPSLKPLLPGGLGPTSAAQLGSASNYTHHLAGSAAALHITPSTSLPPPTPAIRKTSHKAAEQKRRDSLKTSFDQLRTLLPPLPLPNEEPSNVGSTSSGQANNGLPHNIVYANLSGEGPLPGSMPPRGPPRGDVSGPNRAVSKLTLLRCGNEYIKVLKGRVERREVYIGELKREVRALRARVERLERGGELVERTGKGESGSQGQCGGQDGGNGKEVDGTEMDEVTEEIGKVDLDKDIDAEEENAPMLGIGSAGGVSGGEGFGEGDEDD